MEPSHQKTLDAIVTSSDALLVGEDGTRFCQSDDVADITENAHLAGDYYYAIVSEKYLNSIKENGLKEVYPMLNTQDESIDMAALMSGGMPMGAAPAGAEDAASAEMPAGAPAGASAGNFRRCARSLTGILPPKKESCFAAIVPFSQRELSDSSSTTAASNAS